MIKNSKNILFVVGMGRSGTTMLASELSKHKNLCAIPEAQFLVDYISQKRVHDLHSSFLKYVKKHKRFKNSWNVLMDENKELDLKDGYFYLINKYFFENNIEDIYISIDHTPNNIENIDDLFEFFPESKIINLIRDPRAVFNSLKKTDWGEIDPEKFAYDWVRCVALTEMYAKKYDDNILIVKYEDLIEKKGEIQKVYDYIGVSVNGLSPKSKFVLPLYTVGQHKLVGESLDKARIDYWKKKLKNREVQVIEAIAGNFMRNYDYELIYDGKCKKYNNCEIVLSCLKIIMNRPVRRLKYSLRINKKYK
ncbi:hypothetical protein CR164_11715 [Prosthecochloris marina]|uniref:Sulfotransferase family protein n=1 Tax=Prosthecochloris marina TaxID=2017681 RepID=A0A317T4R2_9CHLB|nr:sulfotransferase [Prosthecochloris marina]PWW81200.1 hypothetical protein CR164_11715 [Prosthecochloris marina]